MGFLCFPSLTFLLRLVTTAPHNVNTQGACRGFRCPEPDKKRVLVVTAARCTAVTDSTFTSLHQGIYFPRDKSHKGASSTGNVISQDF